MESRIADDTASELPPKKKIKIDDTDHASRFGSSTSIIEAENEQSSRERAVGIEVFVSDHAGFQGVLKRRYHDFIVHEIMLNGKVVRLDDPIRLLPPPMFAGTRLDGKNSNKPTSGNDVSSISKIESLKADRNGKSDVMETGEAGDAKENLDLKARHVNGHSDTNAQTTHVTNANSNDKGQGTKSTVELTDQTLEQLRKFFDADAIQKLTTLFHDTSEKPQKDKDANVFVDSLPIDDKEDRKNIHQIIRTTYLGRIETAHQDGNIVRCTTAANSTSRRGNNKYKKQKGASNQPIGWDKLGGDYMHFTLYKENRDGADVLGYLSSRLNLRGQKIFDIAGNKDRRAATTQRVSAYRMQADRFLGLNKIITQARIGDCSYSRNKLQLGDLAGNEFLITLRDCVVRMPGSSSATQDPAEIEEHVRLSLQHLRDKGFINYYGLQRFGSFATRTDVVGQYMIKGDFKAAVDTILEFAPQSLEAAQSGNGSEMVSSDDRKRAQAIHWFTTKTASTEDILNTLPRRFGAEHAIISSLSKDKDQSAPYYRGALEAIPRNTRSLYPHAYQSLIWNLAASHRWRMAPNKLVPGDLVLSNRAASNSRQPTYDAQGDPIYTASGDQVDSADVHVLTEEDITNGTYTIFDVVLPQPGFDVKYPSFMLPVYREIMREHGGIDPENMRRSWRDISLPGAYRKLLGRPAKEWAIDLVWYTEPDAKIAITDLELLEWKKQQQAKEEDEAMGGPEQSSESTPLAISISPTSGIALAADIAAGPRLAILLRFQLSSSTYATMALRELLKTGPVEYKPEFSGGRGL